MRRGNRAHGRKSARWLSPEAIAAKQLRRRLERRWKKTKAEADRVLYHTACRKANQLINASRNQHRCHQISEGNHRRDWSAVKNLLHGDCGAVDELQNRNQAAFVQILAYYFIN